MRRAANGKFLVLLKILLFMIVTLMALGAGVRAMNAGLSCPDWPLCFGKVIPDFHPAVWFEFVHRAYAGLVAILFIGSSCYVLFSSRSPRAAKRAAGFGLVFLVLQILAGALTVLMLVKWVAVTSHLLLATLFFCSTFWMFQSLQGYIEKPVQAAPRLLRRVSGLFSLLIFLQIALGGVVASTYAGSVCVDWPLCNGQWVPTWQGAIGHQIVHRFMAYFLAVGILVYAGVLNSRPRFSWLTAQLLRLSRWNAALVVVQVCLGIANLLLFIPPSVTVLHQSGAVLLLAVNLRTYFVARQVVAAVEAPATSQNARPATVQVARGVSG